AMLKHPSAGPQGPVPTYARRARLGYTMACNELGLEAQVLVGPTAPDAVNACGREQLLDGHRFVGVLGHPDLAFGILGRPFSHIEVPCPDDVQVVAIAPADLATNGPWEVSAVDLPIPAIGRTAVAMAVERLGSQEVPAHSRLLSPAFFPRATTRP